jgi:hypothetical protein
VLLNTVLVAHSSGKSFRYLILFACITSVVHAETFDVSKVGLNPKAFSELIVLTNLNYDGSLKDLVTQTQAQWLRKPGTERWDIVEKLNYLKDKVYVIVNKLGLIDEWYPSKKQYNYALIFGARLALVRSRLDYLTKLWDQGVRFDQIVLLGGQRDLSPIELKILKEEYGRTDIKSEPEMIQCLYNALDHFEFKKRTMLLIDAPRKILPNGKPWRATTECTVKHWMKQNPKKGTCMLISSQPFCNYQQVVAQTLLPKTFKITTVGKKASKENMVEIYLDTLARTFYQYSSANS